MESCDDSQHCSAFFSSFLYPFSPNGKETAAGEMDDDHDGSASFELAVMVILASLGYRDGFPEELCWGPKCYPRGSGIEKKDLGSIFLIRPGLTNLPNQERF